MHLGQRGQQALRWGRGVEGERASNPPTNVQSSTRLAGLNKRDKPKHQNRELTNRSENQQEQITTLKKRVKALQKDLANEREQLKELTQYDPKRMKKNLDANKKKLAEKTKANELLQKSLKEARGEKLETERKMQELEQELEGLKAKLEPEEKAA